MNSWKDDVLAAMFLTILVLLGHILADSFIQLTSLVWKDVQHVFK